MKTQNTNKILLATLILTFGVLIVIAVKEKYPTRIAQLITRYTSNGIKDDDLIKFNQHPTDIIEFQAGSGDSVMKIAIIGNSITIHQEAPQMGWNHVSGMAASQVDKDYVHQFASLMSEKFTENTFSFIVANYASIERNPSTLSKDKLDCLLNFRPDLLVLQLSENTEIDSLPVFEAKYVELINLFKEQCDPKIYCVSSFFASHEKVKAIERAALQTNSHFVSLPDLTLLDKENFAKNEEDYPLDKSKWNNDGIGFHPGDKGMKNIALRLFTTVSATVKN